MYHDLIHRLGIRTEVPTRPSFQPFPMLLPHHIHAFELMISTTVFRQHHSHLSPHHITFHNLHSGFKLAPPTRNPSISACCARSLQFLPLTLPPYRMRVASAVSLPSDEDIHLRIPAWTSWACSVVATLPVPMALGYVLGGCRREAGHSEKDVPDRLVGNDNLRPVLNLLCDGLKLARDDLDGLVGLSLLFTDHQHAFLAPSFLSFHPSYSTHLQALTTAQNDAQPSINRRLRLARHERVLLLQRHPPLAVSQ